MKPQMRLAILRDHRIPKFVHGPTFAVISAASYGVCRIWHGVQSQCVYLRVPQRRWAWRPRSVSNCPPNSQEPAGEIRVFDPPGRQRSVSAPRSRDVSERPEVYRPQRYETKPLP